MCMIYIYIERRRGKKGIQARVKGKKKNWFWLRLIKHTSRKKRNKAKHAHDAYVRRKIQAKKKGHVTAHTRKK